MAISVSIVIFIFLITVFLSLGIAGVIVGAAGTSWWEITGDIERGLWKQCNPSTCTNRDNILKFKDTNTKDGARDLDAIMLALILGAIFGFVALIPTLSMAILCRRRSKSINMAAVLTTLFSFIAATSSLGAVIFAEVQFEDLFDKHDRGWASIIAWIGAIFMFFAFAFGFCTVCGTAYNKHESATASYDPKPTQSGMAGRSVNGQVNKGYELQ